MSGTPSSSEGGSTRRVARNTIVLVAGDAATKIGLFVLYALIARSLGQDGFGDYTVAVSLAFFVRVAGLGIDVIVSREVARDPDNVHQIFWETNQLKLLTGVPVLALVTGIAIVSGYSGGIVATVLLIGLSNLVDVLAFTYHAVLRGHEDMAPGSKALAFESLLIVLLGAVALAALDANLVALGVGYLLAAFAAYWYIRREVHRREIRPERRRGRGLAWLWQAALPTAIASFFAYALGRIDAVILSAVTDDAGAVGLYGAAYRIFEATLFVSWAFGLAVLPMISRLQRRSPELNRFFTVSCMAISAITIPIGGAMAFFGPALVDVVFGGDFAGGGTAARILGGSAALNGVFTVAALTITGQDQQRALPWIGAAALSVNVALNLILIPGMGLDGAAVAMTAAQAVMTVASLGLAMRETGLISPVRVLAAPLAGLAAMAGVALLVTESIGGLLLSIPAYVMVFLAMEWLLHRDDLKLFLGGMLRRGGQPLAGALDADAEVDRAP